MVKGTKTGITFFAGELAGTNLASYGESDHHKSNEKWGFDLGNVNFDNLSIDTEGKKIVVDVQKDKRSGVSIDISVIKSLMTLKNISGKSIVKFYYENLPYTLENGVVVYSETIKIIVPIGTSGFLKIYIRSNE